MWYVQMDAVLQVGENQYSHLPSMPNVMDVYESNIPRRNTDDTDRDHTEEEDARLYVPSTV